MTVPLPRFVVAKTLADGRVAFYFYVPGKYRKVGCTVANQPLGRDYAVACGEDGNGGRAAALNAQFDEWQGKFDAGYQSQASARRYTARFAGCFRNTDEVKRISKRFLFAHDLIMSARCR